MKKYFIIDNMSMISHEFLAKLSMIIGTMRAEIVNGKNDLPFGRLNVVLVGNFHQFLLVISRKLAPLFWPCNSFRDTANEMIGCRIYEKFTTVVQLKEQMCRQ
jgi:hypothetical protein